MMMAGNGLRAPLARVFKAFGTQLWTLRLDMRAVPLQREGTIDDERNLISITLHLS